MRGNFPREKRHLLRILQEDHYVKKTMSHHDRNSPHQKIPMKAERELEIGLIKDL